MSVQITRTVAEHVNLGSYEWAEYSATVTVELDGDLNEQQGTVLIDALNASLDRLVARERARYQELTAEDNSFIHDHPALAQEH